MKIENCTLCLIGILLSLSNFYDYILRGVVTNEDQSLFTAWFHHLWSRWDCCKKILHFHVQSPLVLRNFSNRGFSSFHQHVASINFRKNHYLLLTCLLYILKILCNLNKEKTWLVEFISLFILFLLISRLFAKKLKSCQCKIFTISKFLLFICLLLYPNYTAILLKSG